MSRSDFLHCLMHLYLFFIVSYHLLCHHGGMARDWPRANSHKTSPKPWLPGYVRTRRITIYSTSTPPPSTMASILSTIKSKESSPSGESPWSTAVWVIMSLAIVSLLVGIQLAMKALWDRRQSTPNTGNEEEWTSSQSSHDQVD